ncbi:MAG: DUF192 domain-containing protein [Anaerolineae bacterium]
MSVGTVVELRPRIARGWLQKLLGLIGRREAGPGLLLVGCRWVHTWCMRFGIDAVYLDEEGIVLRVACLEPWLVGPLVRGARAVLELNMGEAQRLGIRRGTKIRLG